LLYIEVGLLNYSLETFHPYFDTVFLAKCYFWICGSCYNVLFFNDCYWSETKYHILKV